MQQRKRMEKRDGLITEERVGSGIVKTGDSEFTVDNRGQFVS